jgi:hypothetical protein
VGELRGSRFLFSSRSASQIVKLSCFRDDVPVTNSRHTNILRQRLLLPSCLVCVLHDSAQIGVAVSRDLQGTNKLREIASS